jgi:hypothetical protein
MTPAQLKALLAEGVKEFAGYRVQIDGSLPYGLKTYTSVSACPSGLAKFTVIEDGAKWDEVYTFGCGGDKVHKTPKRNGVLIEFELLGEDGNSVTTTEKAWKSYRLAEIVERDGKKYVRLIVSRKAVVVPWGEYALVEAEREKMELAHEARRAEIRGVADALFIPEPDRATGWGWDRASFNSGWLIRRSEEDDYHSRRREQAHYILPTADYNGSKGLMAYFGKVEMPMDHAQKLVNALDTLRQIADPKNKHSKRAQDLAARAMLEIEFANKPPRAKALAKKKRQAAK